MRSILFSILILCVSSVYSQNWTVQNSGTSETLRHVQFTDLQHGWVVGHNGTILKTSDGGTTWIKVPFSGTANLIGCFFLNESFGWVGGDYAGLYKTTDGGSTWTFQPGPDGITKLFFLDQNTGWAVGGIDGSFPTQGDIYRTTNGGASWSLVSNNTSWARFYGVQFVDASHGWAYAEKNGLLVSTSNAGLSWETLTNYTTYVIRGMYFSTLTTGWITGSDAANGLCLKSTNGGSTWSSIGNQLQYPISNVRFTSDLNGWATSGPAIMKTTDGGVNWSLDYLGATNLGSASLFFADANHGWAVGEEGAIWKYDAGTVGTVEPGSSVKEISLYPNPVTDHATLTVKLAQKDELKISICDLQGKECAGLSVMEIEPGLQSIGLPVDRLIPGIYLVRINGNECNAAVRMNVIR